MTRRVRGERWYRRLLRVYPKDFRDDFGGEMARLYRDRRRTEPAWRLWCSLFVDLLRTAPSEHFSIIRQDLRDASRSLRRTPLVTTTAVLTLALGVGASTAVFSAVHAVLLRPLPYPAAHELVELFEENVATGSVFRASALNYLSWVERSERLDSIGAFQNGNVTLTGDHDPEVIPGSFMTASFFRVLRVPPIAGRTLMPEDELRGSAPVVVLGESLWNRRFGGDRQIVGRWITLDGERYQVIGIMPRAFREVGRSQASGTVEAQLFLPLVIDPTQENRANHTLRAVGRLSSGVSLEQARDELRTIAAGLEQEFPATNANWSVRIEKLTTTMMEPQARRSLVLVLGAVMLVFLIASANVANLMLVRGSRRHPELALRTALGARPSRIVRQLLTESICLAAISGAAGVLAAWIAHPMVRTLLPPTLPRLDETRVDLTVLAFGILMSLTSAIVFGITPAIRASRVDLSQSLTSGRSGAAASRHWIQEVLIAGQMGLATILLVGTALLLQGFVRLQRVPLGFEPNDVFTARVSLPGTAYSDAGHTAAFYDQVITTMRASGDVDAVGIATSTPFGPGVRASFHVRAKGQSATESTSGEAAAQHVVSDDYFRVLRIPLLAGRVFDDSDNRGSTPVAIVTERVTRVLWPNANPLGQIVERDGKAYVVVGVVGDVRGSDTAGARGGGPERQPRAAVYFSADQSPQRTMTLLVRSKREPAGIAATIRAAIRDADPSLPVQQVRRLDDWVTDSVAPARATTTLSTAFAGCALALASVGIYGVLAYFVASRTREIGVRMAIGATRLAVVRFVVGQGMRWAAGGIAVGLLGALAASRLMATLLFDVPADDPMTFAFAAATISLVAVLACAIPALRAVRIDPTVALHME